jgi:hypothetical protein
MALPSNSMDFLGDAIGQTKNLLKHVEQQRALYQKSLDQGLKPALHQLQRAESLAAKALALEAQLQSLLELSNAPGIADGTADEERDQRSGARPSSSPPVPRQRSHPSLPTSLPTMPSGRLQRHLPPVTSVPASSRPALLRTMRTVQHTRQLVQKLVKDERMAAVYSGASPRAQLVPRGPGEPRTASHRTRAAKGAEGVGQEALSGASLDESSSYFGAEALLQSVSSGAIGALRGRFIIECNTMRKKLVRRQELPQSAFWTVEDSPQGPGLRTMLDRLVVKLGPVEGEKRFAKLFVALSYR